MKFIFVDTETVDIPQDTGRPINDIDNWPSIRQIAWIVCDENRRIVKQQNYVIGSTHPVDRSVENYYPQEIKPIHKIIPLWMQDLESCVYLIGHNVEYDVKVIAAEMFRLGYGTQSIEAIPQICTMRSSVDFCYFAGRVDSRYPKLQELYTKLFHEPFMNAHDAYCDIFATYKCFWALVDRDIISKRDYEELYTQQELIEHYNSLSTIVTKEDKKNAKKDDYGVTYSADGKRLLSTRNQYDTAVLKGNYSIPDGVEVICDCAFWGSKELKRLEIPKSVKKIGSNAFAFCNKLQLLCYSPYFGSIIYRPYGHDLYDKKNNRIIAFFDNPGGVIEISPSTVNPIFPKVDYNNTVHIENVGNGSLEIGSRAFAGSCIEHITIGEGVSINSYAFYMCRRLVSISLPDTLTEMPEHFLSDCCELRSINFPQHLKKIDVGALFYCISLKRIVLPQSVSEIGGYAFKCCEGLEEISIPDAVTHINEETFANCGQLKTFEISDRIDSIATNPFVQCFNLKISSSKRFVFDGDALYDDVEKRLISYVGTSNSYSVRDGTLIIGDQAFYNCKSLTVIHLPESVTSIGVEAFDGCENLQSINIPSSITTIKTHTFAHCKSITQLSIPFSVSVIEDHAFYDCESLTDLFVYNPKIHLTGSYHFLSCDALENIYVPEGTMEQFMRNWSFADKRKLIREPGTFGALKRWWKNK